MAQTLNRSAEYGKQIDFGRTAGDYGRGLPRCAGRAARYRLNGWGCPDRVVLPAAVAKTRAGLGNEAQFFLRRFFRPPAAARDAQAAAGAEPSEVDAVPVSVTSKESI